eukprot:jgi/Chlat1/7054/Chrsp56S06720
MQTSTTPTYGTTGTTQGITQGMAGTGLGSAVAGVAQSFEPGHRGLQGVLHGEHMGKLERTIVQEQVFTTVDVQPRIERRRYLALSAPRLPADAGFPIQRDRAIWEELRDFAERNRASYEYLTNFGTNIFDASASLLGAELPGLRLETAEVETLLGYRVRERIVQPQAIVQTVEQVTEREYISEQEVGGVVTNITTSSMGGAFSSSLPGATTTQTSSYTTSSSPMSYASPTEGQEEYDHEGQPKKQGIISKIKDKVLGKSSTDTSSDTTSPTYAAGQTMSPTTGFQSSSPMHGGMPTGQPHMMTGGSPILGSSTPTMGMTTPTSSDFVTTSVGTGAIAANAQRVGEPVVVQGPARVEKVEEPIIQKQALRYEEVDWEAAGPVGNSSRLRDMNTRLRTRLQEQLAPIRAWLATYDAMRGRIEALEYKESAKYEARESLERAYARHKESLGAASVEEQGTLATTYQTEAQTLERAAMAAMQEYQRDEEALHAELMSLLKSAYSLRANLARAMEYLAKAFEENALAWREEVPNGPFSGGRTVGPYVHDNLLEQEQSQQPTSAYSSAPGYPSKTPVAATNTYGQPATSAAY